ncbi:Flagellar M-ring protein [Cedecea neteri]|uniref:Flagellar M-ring protein n=1 Tax=Cedecea neteri TaxID=158822 RepID=A0A2X3J4T8_9ENTR|nr:Flagellar M-ring protein [Cedecea neteri]
MSKNPLPPPLPLALNLAVRSMKGKLMPSCIWFPAPSLGLPPGNVTLVDQGGHLLTQSNNAGRDLNDAQLKYATDVESRYQRRIESILGPIVGNGNVHAQVTAQIDFANKEQTEEQYHPNGDPAQTAVRSRQLNQTSQVNGQFPGGVPGALSNQPAPANTAPISTPPQNNQANQQANNGQQNQTSTSSQNGSSNTSRDETTNYEVDRTIRHTKLNVGDIQRLSVAVVVNYRQLADGKPLPLTADQMKQIENLTREAMGYSEARGDTLNVGQLAVYRYRGRHRQQSAILEVSGLLRHAALRQVAG